ncbi:hypothetical protein C8J56DRAFT_903358 [Mycena floridula]|nr:hypothetical protein C8J56DRAFT_903358 [Mycena floridula]
MTLIVTILVVHQVTLLDRYISLAKSLETLWLLMSDIDKAIQDTITGSIVLNAQFLNEVNESHYQASKKEGQALLNKIKTHGERENMQRLDWKEMAGLRKRNI